MSWINEPNNPFRIRRITTRDLGADSFIIRDTQIVDNPDDGKDPRPENEIKKNRKKRYSKGSNPAKIEMPIETKKTNLKTHLADFKKLYSDIKYQEPKNILLYCPRCVELKQFVRITKEMGSLNPITMEEMLVYMCPKCKHKFSDHYKSMFPHATIEALCQFNAYIGNFEPNKAIDIITFGE